MGERVYTQPSQVEEAVLQREQRGSFWPGGCLCREGRERPCPRGKPVPGARGKAPLGRVLVLQQEGTGCHVLDGSLDGVEPSSCLQAVALKSTLRSRLDLHFENYRLLLSLSCLWEGEETTTGVSRSLSVPSC